MTALRSRHEAAHALFKLNPDRPPGRKTERKNPRRSTNELPDWTVSIVLTQGKSLKPGETFGITGLKATAWNTVSVLGKNKEWVVGQASAFLTHMSIPRHQAVLTKADEPGPTASGPLRKGFSRAIWIDASPRSGHWLEKDEHGVIGMHLLLPLFEG